MNAERSGYREAKHQEPLGILPAFIIGIHNLASRGRIGESKFVGFTKELMLKAADLLFLVVFVMNDKASNQLVELSSGTSEYNPIKDFDDIIRVEVVKAEFDYSDPKTNFVLKKGQPHLRIHLYSGFSSEQMNKVLRRRLRRQWEKSGKQWGK